MNFRPWAYVTAAWTENPRQRKNEAKKYCRQLYEAGFTPICPVLIFPEFLSQENADERKDQKYMAEEMLRRSRIVVVCGDSKDDVVTNDIAVADHYRIPVTTLNGVLSVDGRKG